MYIPPALTQVVLDSEFLKQLGLLPLYIVLVVVIIVLLIVLITFIKQQDQQSEERGAETKAQLAQINTLVSVIANQQNELKDLREDQKAFAASLEKNVAANQSTVSLLGEQNKILTTQNNSLADLRGDTQQTNRSFLDAFKQAGADHSDALAASSRDIKERVSTLEDRLIAAVAAHRKEIGESISESSKAIQDSVQDMQQQLERLSRDYAQDAELTKVRQELADLKDFWQQLIDRVVAVVGNPKADADSHANLAAYLDAHKADEVKPVEPQTNPLALPAAIAPSGLPILPAESKSPDAVLPEQAPKPEPKPDEARPDAPATTV